MYNGSIPFPGICIVFIFVTSAWYEIIIAYIPIIKKINT